MTPLRALSVVAAYAHVLRRIPWVHRGCALSLLRDDKATIMEAIRQVAVSGATDRHVLSTLEHAYSQLAFFIPDEEVAIVVTAHEAQASGDRRHEGLADVTRANQITARMRSQQHALLKEFRSLRHRPPDR